MHRAVIVSTNDVKVFDAFCEWADSHALDERIVANCHEGVGSVVLLPTGKEGDQAHEEILTELGRRPGVWAIVNVAYSPDGVVLDNQCKCIHF
jgi:hypothetical protein